MTTALTTVDDNALLKLVSDGDCSKLTPDQKLQYYKARCESAGLDPKTQPFQLIKMNGKEVLYATKETSAQLSLKHGIQCAITDKAEINGVYVVTVKATCKDGRSTEDIGAVKIENLKNDVLANALMKCVTKAKRRAILSVCGLGMLDESELETIPNAEPQPTPRERHAPEPSKLTEGGLNEAQMAKIKEWAASCENVDAFKFIVMDLCGPHATSSDKLNQADFAKLSDHFSKVKEQK